MPFIRWDCQIGGANPFRLPVLKHQLCMPSFHDTNSLHMDCLLTLSRYIYISKLVGEHDIGCDAAGSMKFLHVLYNCQGQSWCEIRSNAIFYPRVQSTKSISWGDTPIEVPFRVHSMSSGSWTIWLRFAKGEAFMVSQMLSPHVFLCPKKGI